MVRFKVNNETVNMSVENTGVITISAYDIAVKHGFKGTETEWLDSLAGKSAYKYALEGGYLGTEKDFTEQLASFSGVPGEKGEPFKYEDFTEEQLASLRGEKGYSAYDYAKLGGYLGTEEEFAEKLATDYIDWFGTGIAIPEGADLDTYKTNGKYYCHSESRAKTLLNRPDGMNTNFVMWVFSRTSSTIKSQLMLTLAGKMYIRSSNSNAFRTWVAYTTSAEIDTMKEELKQEILEAIDSGEVYAEPENLLEPIEE